MIVTMLFLTINRVHFFTISIFSVARRKNVSQRVSSLCDIDIKKIGLFQKHFFAQKSFTMAIELHNLYSGKRSLKIIVTITPKPNGSVTLATRQPGRTTPRLSTKRVQTILVSSYTPETNTSISIPSALFQTLVRLPIRVFRMRTVV